MSFLDEIIDRVAEACGADFAFVLSRRGRLVTQNAPKDMPEQGRAELAAHGVTCFLSICASASIQHGRLVQGVNSFVQCKDNT